MEITLDILVGIIITVAITIGNLFVKLIEWIINRFIPRNGNYEKRQFEVMTEIAGNHLHDILSAIEKQTNDNNQWHKDQYEVLCQIKGLLEGKK